MQPTRATTARLTAADFFRLKSRLSTFSRSPPSVSVRAAFDAALPVARFILYRLCLGALLVCGRRLSLPSLLACLTPSARNRQRFSNPTAARTRPNALTLNATPGERFSPLPIRSRGCSPGVPLSHCGALPLFPSRRGLRSLRSRAPRRAPSRRAEWPNFLRWVSR